MQNNSVPWLGVNKWENGRITSGGKLALYLLLGFAVFWNLILAPVIIEQWDDLARIFERLVIYDVTSYDARLIIPLMLAANVFLIAALWVILSPCSARSCSALPFFWAFSSSLKSTCRKANG